MAKDRIVPCEHYVCKGDCNLGRNAEYTGYCQKCNEYVPQKRNIEKVNRRKEKLEKIKKKEFREEL